MGHDHLTVVPERIQTLAMLWQLKTGELPYLKILDILDSNSVKPLELLE